MQKCFADSGNECRILSTKKCDGCNFYATPEQAESHGRASYERKKRLAVTFTEFDKEYQKEHGDIEQF